MKKAIMYIRRSTDMQEASLEDQRDAIRAYAQSNGFGIVREFCDDAISGKTVEARPAFQNMIEFARTAKENYTLLVYDVSRFGRFENPKEATYWEVELEKHNVTVNYITEGFTNDGSLGSYITKVVKDAEASEYIKKLAKLTKRGIRSCAERGFWTTGRAPFGYLRAVIDPTTGNIEKILQFGEQRALKGKRIKLIPDETKADILRKIFDLYANHEQGIRSVVDYLNSNRVPNPSGKPYWYSSTVRNVLKNPVYTGLIVLHKNKTEEVVAEDSHEALIDKDIFLKAQERLKQRRFGKRGGYITPYTLTSLIQCEHCGHNLHGATDHNVRGYRCSGYTEKGKHVCQSPRYRAELLEQPVLDHIQTTIQDPSWPQKVQQAIDHALGQDQQTLDQKLKESQTEYTQNKTRIRNLLEAIADGLPRETAIRAVTELEERQTNLENIITDLECKEQEGTQHQQTAQTLLLLHSQWQEQYEQTTYQEKKKLVRLFLAKATINHETKTITYQFYTHPNLITDETLEPPPTETIQTRIMNGTSSTEKTQLLMPAKKDIQNENKPNVSTTRRKTLFYD